MKKMILPLLILSLIFLSACSEPVGNAQFTLTSFESQLSIDGDFLIGQLNYVSANEITLTVDYPEEIKGMEFKQTTFGIDISFEGTQIHEFQSEVFGFHLSPIEELFEYLSVLGENHFMVDENGNFKAETNYDIINGIFDLHANQIVSIESENHRFDFMIHSE